MYENDKEDQLKELSKEEMEQVLGSFLSEHISPMGYHALDRTSGFRHDDDQHSLAPRLHFPKTH